MNVKEVAIIVAVLLIFLGIVLAEIAIEIETRQYSCYMGKFYKDEAENFSCPGENEDKCKRCPYNKKYQRSE